MASSRSSGGRYDEYLKNFRKLIEYLNELANGPGRTNNEELARDFARLVGGGEGVPNSVMLGRYQKTKGPDMLKGEVKPPTHLAIARYLRKKTQDPRWGWSGADRDGIEQDQAALIALYDWLKYGPAGAPPDAPPNRHAKRPTAEKIAAALSPTVAAFTDAIPRMSAPELVKVLSLVAETLQYRVEDGSSLAPEAIEPEPEPEPICEDTKALPTLLLVSMGMARPVTDDSVSKLAHITKLEENRCKVLLCGQDPTDDELPNLSIAAKMSVADLANFIRASNAISAVSQ